ncbi:MAG TPA: HlyD family efflux transporter periplasmic adaptor subunit [Caldithrix abyssi]|uniref:HlyD family efflux transporter periplasmic adaptor subunit n=1 Tax=Caldithrix abyssi TaxID=187145 RepID=A0A7V4U1F3_CALAY|nr:HlyD family efflux transporter periplasmic adaptor subunit [Caldithrix abyssi]
MKNRFKTIFLNGLLAVFVTTAVVLLQSCANGSDAEKTKDTHKEESMEEEGHEQEEIVRFSAEELKEFGIETAVAGPGKLQVHIDLTGEIVIDPDRLAHIFPRFPGIVKNVRKKIGDKVKKGEVLAIIESNESLVPYEVKSLINGTVIEMHLTLGEVVNDARHAFLIADLSHVWANLNVYQKDLPYVKIGRKATISAGYGIKEAVGVISYISPVVDEMTRTATARVVLPNPDGRWRPGLFVNATVVKEEMEVDIIVPKTALENFENQTVVFIKTDEGFKPQPVSVGRSNTYSVEIIAGLQAGQEYVSKGGFTIKAELQKSELGEGHGH